MIQKIEAPTMKLRWKIRPGPTQHMQPILQQWWDVWELGEGGRKDCGEWRDVPFQAAA